MAKGKDVFVAYGRNDEARKALFGFLRSLHLNPIEWIQAVTKSGSTATIGQIVSKGLSEADGIIILMTPDDEVSLRPELRNKNDYDEKNYRFQSRPNVAFEAGLAMGLFREKTIFVCLGEVKPFSDIQGIHYLTLDNDPASKHNLVEKLKSIGLVVNDSGSDFLREGNFQEAIDFPWTLAKITDYYSVYSEKWKKKIWESDDHKLAKSLVKNVMLDKTKCITCYPENKFSDIFDEIVNRMKLDSDNLPFVAVLKSKESWELAGVITPSDLAVPSKHKLYWNKPETTAAAICTFNPYHVKLNMTWEKAEDYRKEMSIKSGLPVLGTGRHFAGWFPPLAGRDFMAD